MTKPSPRSTGSFRANPDTPRRGFGPERTGPIAAYPPGPKGEAPRLNILPLELDLPLHRPYRQALEPLFSPHAVIELAPWLLALTNRLIDAIIEKGEGDFSPDLSTPLAGIFTMKFAGPAYPPRKDVLTSSYQSIYEETCLRTNDGDSPANAVRIGGFARLPGSSAL